MTLRRYLVLQFALTLGVVVMPAGTAFSQQFPSRPVTLVAPFAAGGPLDTVARIVAEGMRESLRQTVVVENVGGAGGSIGVGRVARAAPDGYTLSYSGWATHVVNGAAYALSYDLRKDFEPVALTVNLPWLIVAKNGMAASDLKGLIAWLKANPGKASAGTSGLGSPAHVFGVFFQNTTETRFQLVPYRGNGPAMQDLLAGQIDLMFDSPTNSLPHIRAGTVKVFAVMAKSRLTAAPDIPTVDEAGLSGFYMPVWQAIYAPSGTPKEAIAKLNAAVVNALANATVRSRLAELGQEIFPREQQTPEALGAYHKAEIEKWWPIIKAAGIKAE